MAVDGAAFIALTRKAISAVSDFDHAFLLIKQLNLDKSAAELDSYRNQVRDAAFDVGINFGKATNAIHDLQSGAGVFGDEAIEFFKKVGWYSLATGADVCLSKMRFWLIGISTILKPHLLLQLTFIVVLNSCVLPAIFLQTDHLGLKFLDYIRVINEILLEMESAKTG